MALERARSPTATLPIVRPMLTAMPKSVTRRSADNWADAVAGTFMVEH